MVLLRVCVGEPGVSTSVTAVVCFLLLSKQVGAGLFIRLLASLSRPVISCGHPDILSPPRLHIRRVLRQ